MTENHPITPPPSLTDKWNNLPLSTEEIFVIAAQWGSDQELEACCEWLQDPDLNVDTYKLRAARRPKPPSLKEQALAALYRADKDVITNPITGEVVDLRTILSKEQSGTIRKALEALPND